MSQFHRVDFVPGVENGQLNLPNHLIEAGEYILGNKVVENLSELQELGRIRK